MEKAKNLVQARIMCVIAFAYKMPGLGQLVLLANRDEFYNRPSAPLDWWQEYPNTLGGKDLVSGGSWLMVDGRGRFAAVTNIRNGMPGKGNRSRGELVQRFVSGNDDALAFADWLKNEYPHYGPFNLIFGQTSDLFHFHSQGAKLSRITPGIHSMSNATLDTHWYKSEQLTEHLKQLSRPPSEEMAYQWLADPTPAPQERLPNTGIGSAMEKMLSPIFIRSRDYGTRSSLLLTVSSRGDVVFGERSWGLAGQETGRRRYTIKPGQQPLLK